MGEPPWWPNASIFQQRISATGQNPPPLTLDAIMQPDECTEKKKKLNFKKGCLQR
jgi:hypothetical protein